MKIFGFAKTPTAKLRRNRFNYGVIVALWVGFVVFTVTVNGETQASTWVGVTVIVLVLAVIAASEIELRRRTRAGDDGAAG